MDENTRLLEHLSEQYLTEYPNAGSEWERAEGSLIHGGSHTLRLFHPAPFRLKSASGSRVYDVDGHEILDFWQGHYANILGHNPPLITKAIKAGL